MPHHLVLQRPDIGRCDLSFLPPLPTRPSENENGSILRFEVPENFAPAASRAMKRRQNAMSGKPVAENAVS